MIWQQQQSVNRAIWIMALSFAGCVASASAQCANVTELFSNRIANPSPTNPGLNPITRDGCSVGLKYYNGGFVSNAISSPVHAASEEACFYQCFCNTSCLTMNYNVTGVTCDFGENPPTDIEWDPTMNGYYIVRGACAETTAVTSTPTTTPPTTTAPAHCTDPGALFSNRSTYITPSYPGINPVECNGCTVGLYYYQGGQVPNNMSAPVPAESEESCFSQCFLDPNCVTLNYYSMADTCSFGQTPPTEVAWDPTVNGFYIVREGCVTMPTPTITSTTTPATTTPSITSNNIVITGVTSTPYVNDALTCSADCVPPANSFTWTQNSLTIVSHTASLVLTQTGSFIYTCTVTNVFDGVTSSASKSVTLQVSIRPVPIVASDITITGMAGTAGSYYQYVGGKLSCSSSSTPAANTFTWKNANTAVVSYTASCPLSQSCAVTTYTCTATNVVAGITYSASKTVSLQIWPNPPFVQDITVYYSSTASPPAGAVTEIHGLSNDINYGFHGSYVYLVPTYTNTLSLAVTMFAVYAQDTVDPLHNDLAKGAGGKYRYLIPQKDNVLCAVTHLSLWRSSSASDKPPNTSPITITSDINVQRGGTYLYLYWG